jgi:hypothetical protein
MTDRTACAHCGKVGFVRRERVITGNNVFVDHYCGRCEHAWQVAEANERRALPRTTPAVTERPDRSRAPGLYDKRASRDDEKPRAVKRNANRR